MSGPSAEDQSLSLIGGTDIRAVTVSTDMVE